ncbi:hypothetical protein ID866_2723 [Astraeus odoratus]|nr:hypothetical protein ID866_2723 [Astraeus odoratus]
MDGRKRPLPQLTSRRPERIVIDASRVATVHTYLALAAFCSALLLGCALHYKKIVKNGVAGYPDEWFPSVSATQLVATAQKISTLNDSEPSRNVSDDAGPQKVTKSKTVTSNSPIAKHYFAALVESLWAPDTRRILSFIADVYFSYLFWSIVTSLLTTLFYFSVWELGLSGAEAAAFMYLSPALLGISPLRRWAISRWGRVTLRIFSLAGLAAYKLDSPLTRLYAVAGANLSVLVSQASDWMTCHDAYQGLLLGLGLVLSSLSKQANHSNNPVNQFGPC